MLYRNRIWGNLLERCGRDSAPVWRHLPWLLCAAIALRLAVAISSNYIWRPDEASTYLEQAHRIVFGYGFLSQSVEAGIRSWMIIGVPIGVLQICALLGLDHPDYYVPIMRSFNATISMAIPLGTYFFCRRILCESTARIALVITCFWYEFIVMSPHTLAEFYATSLFFAAAAIFARNPSTVRASSIGFLLGLALSFRVHYVCAIVPLGCMLLFLFRTNIARMSLVAGGMFALFIWGLVDFFTLGGWWMSAYNYYVDVSSSWAAIPHFIITPFGRLLKFLIPSIGLFAISIVWGIFRWKILFPVIVPLLGTYCFHILLPSEYSNFQIAIALSAICAADICKHIGTHASTAALLKKLSLYAALSTISVLSFAGLLPGFKYIELAHNKYVLHTSSSIGAIQHLSRLPQASVQSVFFDHAFSERSSESYYFLHHNVPFILPGSNYSHILQDVGYEQTAVMLASHIISTTPACWSNYKIIGQSGTWKVMQRNSPPTESIARENFDYRLVRDSSTLPALVANFHSRRKECL